MFTISLTISIGVIALILRGAYVAMFNKEPGGVVRLNLSHEQRLRRAYRSAYVMHMSLSDKVHESCKDS